MHFFKSNPQRTPYISLPQGITERIEDYSRKVRLNRIACILPSCPRCAVSPDQFNRHELRRRHFLVVIEQVVHTFYGLLIRWACPGCGKTFSQYPDFALPYKRYVVPDIMQYAERYVENEKTSYARVIQKWAAGYERHAGDERQLWPSTIHRWITTLGAMLRVIAIVLQLIHQKDPDAAVTRLLSQLTMPPRKHTSEARRLILIHCRRLLLLERLFRRIFQASIFEKIAATCAYA